MSTFSRKASAIGFCNRLVRNYFPSQLLETQVQLCSQMLTEIGESSMLKTNFVA
jgi:hypothetical protein